MTSFNLCRTVSAGIMLSHRDSTAQEETPCPSLSHLSCQALLSCADPSEAFGIFSLGKYHVLCQVKLWEAMQGSSCSRCTFKKPHRYSAASEPRGCPHCHEIICAFPALLKSSGSACQAKAAGTGLTLLAGDAP